MTTYDPSDIAGGEDIALLTGKHARTVHLGFDIACGPADAQPYKDLALQPAEGDTLTVIMFKDKIDGERHYYVLNEEYRRRLVDWLTGVTVAPAAVLELIKQPGG